MNDIQYIKSISQLNEKGIQSTLELLSGGATIPFISRYRKDQTGGMDEVQVGQIRDLHKKYTVVTAKQKVVIDAIDDKNELTADLKTKIINTFDLNVLEDIYLPYKVKRKTKSDTAKAQGLEPLAKMIMSQKGSDPVGMAKRFVVKDVKTVDAALEGAKAIISEWISENAIVRSRLREMFTKRSTVTSKLSKGKEVEAEKFKDYFDHSEAASRIPSHRFLAIFRADREGLLNLKVRPNDDDCFDFLQRFFVKSNDLDGDFVFQTCKDAYRKSIRTSLENEQISILKQKADESAVNVFSKNLQQLLLTAPLGQKRILAIDPGYKSGCKVVCLDQNGELLNNCNIFPHAPQKEMQKAKAKISQLVQMYKIQAVAIGDGTAGRETEYMIKNVHFDREVEVYVVNEDGASVYSASSIARKEFPQFDVTVRGAVSIGRRLMDPLAELVKIDPKAVGVGQYQHEINQTLLKDSLDDVVVSCVNRVGVDLNTASSYLLKYVSGVGDTLAENIVAYRTENGSFNSIDELKKVKRFGAKAFEQAAGFLRIRNGQNVLDQSAVHPESYGVVKKISQQLNISIDKLIGDNEKLAQLKSDDYAFVDSYTFNDILNELKKPGRDPRKKTKIIEFDSSIKTINDLIVGSELVGVISNVTNFGAFVNIGIKENGLIHKSNMAKGFVNDPLEHVSLNEHVKVQVLEVDAQRKRIGLKLIND